MRIQTQLDDQRLQKLRYLVETTRTSANEVIGQAIDFYYSRFFEDCCGVKRS